MELEFKVTMEEANLILQALGEVPAKLSMVLIGKLQEQAKEQIDNTRAVE
ncbi:MAG TPA: hypothetical protein VMV32_10520 [Ignavibacteriaceae bacterium]|nr:hypothetical protein [Ignavibacteriaceae bacterium]